MSSVRGRRGTSSSEGRGYRQTGRAPRVQATGPVSGGVRTHVNRRPGRRRAGRRPGRTATTSAGRRRPLFTGRAVLLAALILLLALTLAGPLRQYLAGQSELDQLADEGQQLDHRVAQLQKELAQQSDPAYSVREARERLTYVLPGDRLVVVVDGEAVGGTDPAPAATNSAPKPWYLGLLDSVAAADG